MARIPTISSTKITPTCELRRSRIVSETETKASVPVTCILPADDGTPLSPLHSHCPLLTLVPSVCPCFCTPCFLPSCISPSQFLVTTSPFSGRLAPLQSQSSLLSQVCQKAKQYAGFSIPVAITEWSVSTAIWDDAQWNGEFYAAQIRAWAQSGGGVFWSYRVNAYTEKFNQTENFTLYSFVDLARLGQIPLPTNNQTSAEYLASFPGTCNFDAPRDTYASSIASAPVTVTNAFTKRAFGSAAEPTPAPL